MKQYKLSDKFLGLIGKIFPIRGKWLAACSVSLVVIIIGAGGYFIKQQKLSAVESPKVVQAIQIKKVAVKKAVVIKQNDNTKAISSDELAVYNTMHKMINTKIVAGDGKIWGEVEITPEKCQVLITKVNASGYLDKVTLLQFLTHWKDNDFDSGVNEHNYLWDGLDGTIGKAKSLRP